MGIRQSYTYFACLLAIGLMSASCANRAAESSTVVDDSDSVAAVVDTIVEDGVAEVEPVDSIEMQGGILPVIAENAPEYYEKLLQNTSGGFIVVDKASMRVILYDRAGHLQKAYGMACAKNYGTKHQKADSRTPEGFFSVEGKYDSTEWLFTDDDGVTSKKKGQFGPRFIRLRIPTTSQIGIHGTCSPWSIEHRVSHGCIRILNENILELVDLVEVGMPVIVLPGIRDRKVNREEGYDIPYFPTDPKYAMSAAEKKLKPKTADEIAREKALEEEKEREKELQLEMEKAQADSLKVHEHSDHSDHSESASPAETQQE